MDKLSACSWACWWYPWIHWQWLLELEIINTSGMLLRAAGVISHLQIAEQEIWILLVFFLFFAFWLVVCAVGFFLCVSFVVVVCVFCCCCLFVFFFSLFFPHSAAEIKGLSFQVFFASYFSQFDYLRTILYHIQSLCYCYPHRDLGWFRGAGKIQQTVLFWHSLKPCDF